MRTLAIDCATEACSVALFDGDGLVAGKHVVLGRGHAERLIPMIADLPQRGEAERIAVSIGPGSFTGVRIGIAAARALGVAWKVPVVGFPTLALVAAMAQREHLGQPVTVSMTAGHGQWFIQNFDAAGLPADELASLSPDKAVGAASSSLIAGTQAEALRDLRGSGEFLNMHPDASQFDLLPAAIISDEVRPLYGRAPDAKLPTQK
ncbi:tRNA (adenosine(37)-N6)-threonylcarbamoyltransferase complex dimerization subunit type 1 TsaB [Altererythrobacter sp. ZODW24]|uniref:tRNA (adenosine(37)-N6)-threonylcarbamoyltransferase complex dimerization subunit type 1 TsaB n=1 Tax=Altererythrobacter sp. ZODW24 TaxID=2185142 RepID=UPI000DF84121|nr:tRNA (adenosine(37)-N6)-threonylcarbamoyltransferase complex dimerization subunit type 1 TsaB [Altererythrobacter sp. ZODW24]